MLRNIAAAVAALILLPPALAAEDPYLWLEEVEGEEALDWVRSQNSRTFEELRDSPVFEELYEEAYAIMTSEARLPNGKIVGNDFHDFWQDEQNVRGVWRRTSIDALVAGKPDWKTVLDFDRLSADEAENWVYKDIDCLGGASDRCLVEMSRGGKDESVRREFSLDELDFVANGFIVPEAKSRVAWLNEDALVVATEWGENSLTEAGYPLDARIWKRGEPLDESQALLEVDATDTMLAPARYSSDGEAHVFLVQLLADWNNRRIYPVAGGKAKNALSIPQRHLFEGVIGGKGIIVLKEDWAPDNLQLAAGDIVAIDLQSGAPELVFRPSEQQAIDEVSVAEGGIVLQLLDNVVGRILRVRPTATGWSAAAIDIPDNGVAKIAAASSGREDLFVTYESAIQPTTLYHVGANNGTSIVAQISPLYDASGIVIRQEFATSKDGTQVPFFLIGHEDVLDRGDAPTILYGYGGFLIPILPVYYEDPSRPQHGALAGKMWLSRGGVLVLSNLRGGGEFGPRWHQAALRENRQRAYDDYIAIAEKLVDDGVTTPGKLGALGRSNGGLLLGVALTQRPDLFAAFDIGVPLLDMKRYHKLLAGSSWMGEYGNPDVADDWAFISEYSPYQHLEKGANYPPVLFYTSTQDDRVHPGHARKMAASLEDMGYDFYYYENMEGGHGGTANQDQLAMRTALEYAYFVRRLMPEAWDRSESAVPAGPGAR